MHPTFETFLAPIRDQSAPVGLRLFLASREIALTEQVNADLKRRGDNEGAKFGEEYLAELERLVAGLRGGK